MIKFILSEAWPYLAAVAGIVAGLFYTRQSGKAAGRNEAEQRANKQRLENINEARNVENTINQADDDSVIRGLDKWVRKR